MRVRRKSGSRVGLLYGEGPAQTAGLKTADKLRRVGKRIGLIINPQKRKTRA